MPSHEPVKRLKTAVIVIRLHQSSHGKWYHKAKAEITRDRYLYCSVKSKRIGKRLNADYDVSEVHNVVCEKCIKIYICRSLFRGLFRCILPESENNRLVTGFCLQCLSKYVFRRLVCILHSFRADISFYLAWQQKQFLSFRPIARGW